jgi:hypothetical protein
MSTGGAATKAMMYTDTAVNSRIMIMIPNQPTYRGFQLKLPIHKSEPIKKKFRDVLELQSYVFIKFFKNKFSQIKIYKFTCYK